MATILYHNKQKCNFIALFSIDKIKLLNNHLQCVVIEDMSKCTFCGISLLLNYDVSNNMQWLGEYIEEVKNIDGSLCCPIQFQVNSNKNMSILLSEFNRIKSYFETIINNNTDLVIPQFKGSSIDSIFCLKIITSSNNNELIKCKVENCEKNLKLNQMRLHVGFHILSGHLPHSANTCGYCGLLSCQTKLVLSTGSGINKSYVPSSNCSYFYKFNYECVKKKTKRSPCTNRPIACTICSHYYWFYNMEQHYKDKHPLNITDCLKPDQSEIEDVLSSH